MTTTPKSAEKPPQSAGVKPNNTDKVPADTNVDANAKTQVLHSGGSPANAGLTDVDKGKGGTVATEGNKSPTKVGSDTADNSPATGPGGHANIAAATQDPKDPAVVKPEDVAHKTGGLSGSLTPTDHGKVAEGVDAAKADLDATTDQAAKDAAEFEKALNEEDVTETPDEKELDEFDRRENNGKTREELLAERDAIDAALSIDARKSEEPRQTVSRQQEEHERNELNAAFDKLVKIDSVVLPSTPDSHIAWGVGGVTLTLGDLRKIARAFVKGGSRV